MAGGDWAGRPARRLRAWVRANLPPYCHWCGLWIDDALPFNHPMAGTVEHLHARVDGGPARDKDNFARAHRSCNSRRLNVQTRNVPRQRRPQTREW